MLGRLILRLVLGLLLPAGLAACTTWRLARVPPQELFANRAPERVRVTRPDSTVLTLDDPALSGENLVGTRGGATVTVPLAEVSLLEFRASDPTTTVVLVGILVGVTVGFLAIASAAAGGPGS